MDEQSLAGLSIDEITVKEIYSTSTGGVARVRARSRDVLLRDGDQLADGEVDGIDVIAPTVAWLRFRRRVAIPGVPYRPVVWLLAARESPEAGRRLRRGLTIGGAGVEAHRLGDELLGGKGFPPWIWGLSIENAPRLVAGMLERSDLRKRVRSDRARLLLEPGFGMIEVPFSSREKLREVFRPSYGAATRRDPFLDLSYQARPQPLWNDPGLPTSSDLLIDDLKVEGLFITPWGPVAEVRSAQKHFSLREGDQLYDGDLDRIDLQQGLIFKQIEQDPTTVYPFRQVVKRLDPRWTSAAGASRKTADEAWALADRPAGRRDPFRSLLPTGVPTENPPSALAKLTCDHLTSAGDTIAEVLEQARLRLARYSWERGLVADQQALRTAWARRFLDDIEQTASADLARLFSGLPGLESLRSTPVPPPGEMFALLGDLNLVAGRLAAAAEAYGLAEQTSPGLETLCGRMFDGKLWGAESYLSLSGWNDTRYYWLTGYLLAWDPASGRVLERHLLPAAPEAFAVERGDLQVTLRGAGTVRLAGLRRAAPGRVPANLVLRAAAIENGTLLADNLVNVAFAGPRSSFDVLGPIDDHLPLDLPELEKASRAAALRDPTQPWHLFFLGQALWAEGRRQEAETLWRRIWEGGPWATPYYELLWMAVFHEIYGQRDWADRAFAQALEQRRRLPRPIVASQAAERRINAATSWLDNGLRDPGKRHLWWRRLREISGIAPGDAFRAALWVDDLERRRDRAGARDERAFLRQARRYPFDPVTRSAWLDYSLYVVMACAAMLFARLAVAGSRMVRRRPALRRLRWPGWRQAAQATFRSHGLALLILFMALYLALSLSILAASYLGYLTAVPRELGDVVAARQAQASYEDRYELTTADVLRAWITKGVVEPATQTPARLIQKAQAIRSYSAGARLLLALAGIAAMFVIALPAGLLLAWGRARVVVARCIPGAAQVRAGSRLKGYLVFGLSVFAVAPLAWLVVARTCGAVPAPGIVSANLILRIGVETPLLPLLSNPDERARWSNNFERLRARSFLRLLAVYPGSELFWSLVIAALAASLGAVATVAKPRAP